jgi:phage shock protein PspC (stress-responsive transcriptional regulator)
MRGKRLFRSSSDKMICGVCGGIAQYFGIDSTLIRVGWVALTFLSGGVGGVLAYIVAAIIIPDESKI